MAGNSFGEIFTITTAGESHGYGYTGIVDGCPPGLRLTESDIQKDLDRRKPGQSSYTTQRKESDKVKITAGVFEGVTTGTPIALQILNEDQRSQDYGDIKNKYRPGHADYTYLKKYGIRDYRGGGRASARETCMRVAAGAIAKKFLAEKMSIHIYGYLSKIGDINLNFVDKNFIENNPFFIADPVQIQNVENLVDKLKQAGDSVGALVTVAVDNTPVGLGEPVFDRLDADIAKAMMSINAVKGVEIGEGFNVVSMKGSQNKDEINSSGFVTNNAGGILGGISNGDKIVCNLALKPTSSIKQKSNTIDLDGNEATISTFGRHDPCVGIRAVPIAEAMMALTLMDHYLRHKAQNL